MPFLIRNYGNWDIVPRQRNCMADLPRDISGMTVYSLWIVKISYFKYATMLISRIAVKLNFPIKSNCEELNVNPIIRKLWLIFLEIITEYIFWPWTIRLSNWIWMSLTTINLKFLTWWVISSTTWSLSRKMVTRNYIFLTGTINYWINTGFIPTCMKNRLRELLKVSSSRL